MNLKEKIRNDLKEALKKREELKISTLKILLSSITNSEIQLRKKEEGLSDGETQKIIKSEAKKRKEAAEAYEKGARQELAEKEKNELAILKSYLPEQLSDEEIGKTVKETIAELDAENADDFGKVIKKVMEKTKGQADGNKVSEIIKKLLEN